MLISVRLMIISTWMPYRVPVFDVYIRLSEQSNMVYGKHAHVTEINKQTNTHNKAVTFNLNKVLLELTKHKTVSDTSGLMTACTWAQKQMLFSSANKDRPQFEYCKYFESPHGKEAVNGLGDVKRKVFRNIKVNKVLIDYPGGYVKTFAE